MVVQLHRKRFTVTDYNRMIERGVIREGEPYELLNGEILLKADYQSDPSRMEYKRFTEAEFQTMIAMGVLEEESLYELISGEVFHRYNDRTST